MAHMFPHSHKYCILVFVPVGTFRCIGNEERAKCLVSESGQQTGVHSRLLLYRFTAVSECYHSSTGSVLLQGSLGEKREEWKRKQIQLLHLRTDELQYIIFFI